MEPERLRHRSRGQHPRYIASRSSSPCKGNTNAFLFCPFRAQRLVTIATEGVALGYDVSGLQPETRGSAKKIPVCSTCSAPADLVRKKEIRRMGDLTPT